jgi:2-phospho-L-lactate/phosphoenolpyruvate guanylyltransferase
MILVPVKSLTNAKQRLAPILEPKARQELAEAMLSDTLRALSDSPAETSLVTSDPHAIELARVHGFDVIPDPANLSETDAVEMATLVLLARGVESTLVVPGDIPLVKPAEIRAIFENAPPAGSVLVPAWDRRGTNAVWQKPARLFPLRFGNDSFMPHLASAIRTNYSCVVLSLPGIGLDVDTPLDLDELARAPGERPSQLLARKLGFPQAEPTLTSSSAAPHGLVVAKS